MKLRRRLRQIGEVPLIGLGLITLPFLPRRAIVRMAQGLGYLAYRLSSRMRKVAFANIDLAFGDTIEPSEKDTMVRQSFQTMALTFLDIFWFYRFTARRLARWVTMDPSFESVFAPGAQVAITAHFGNWEVMGLTSAFRGRTPVSVAAPLVNKWADEVLDQARRRTGQVIVQQQGAVKELMRALKEEKLVALLLDQNTRPKEGGVFVPFFGRAVPVSRVPAALLRRTGARMLFTFCAADARGRYRAYARGPYTVEQAGASEEEITAFVMASLESEIRANPGYWLWMYKRWKFVPDGAEMAGYPFYACRVW